MSHIGIILGGARSPGNTAGIAAFVRATLSAKYPTAAVLPVPVSPTSKTGSERERQTASFSRTMREGFVKA